MAHMKRYDFTSFDQFHDSDVAGEYEALTVLDENGWLKSDLMTEGKSWKTALRRFFKLLGDDSRVAGWYEDMRENAEAGCFKMDDFTWGLWQKNDKPSYSWGIEHVGDDGWDVWYIFLNVQYAGYPDASAAQTA